jgi:hypothetical protein
MKPRKTIQARQTTNAQHQGATNNQYYLEKPLVDGYSLHE